MPPSDVLFRSAAAHADGFDIKPIFDARLRSETVHQDGIAESAHAVTLRARLGLETGKLANTSLLLEGDALIPIQDDYRPDPAVQENVIYPVVADPEAYEINRFQLTNTSLPGTTLTLGRQRIGLDDQRFVGAVGWRQNEQTFDALRVVNKSVANLLLDATYLNRVNRVFGDDSPQGDYHGDSVLLNAGYQTKIGKISAFGYLLDFESIATVPAAMNPIRDSTSTYGLRFAGEKPLGKVKVGYVASYATQTEYADNPLSFDLDYKTAELNATFKQFGLGVGAEFMEGNGVKGFTTPLATLHKFQGWADKFLATPVERYRRQVRKRQRQSQDVGRHRHAGSLLSFHDYRRSACRLTTARNGTSHSPPSSSG